LPATQIGGQRRVDISGKWFIAPITFHLHTEAVAETMPYTGDAQYATGIEADLAGGEVLVQPHSFVLQ
jgi:hypothetical protein